MTFSPKRLIDLLEQNGYVLKRITGSHHIYFNKENKKTIVVPIEGNKHIPRGIFVRQAGISKDEL
jgi:predicted RNA binding protein YcfA (HicA-like mRNA interferase family)